MGESFSISPLFFFLFFFLSGELIWNRVYSAPYGNCTAYTCDVPTKFVPDENHWSFFWNEEGLEEGHGAGCIKNPRNGKCGCENSDGKFITGADNCK